LPRWAAGFGERVTHEQFVLIRCASGCVFLVLRGSAFGVVLVERTASDVLLILRRDVVDLIEFQPVVGHVIEFV
jgi:hypothetical protein